MPRVTRNIEEVKKVKEHILESALQLLIEDGFTHFSMRRLALRLGMTAANIYNYFTNKDELYLCIQTRGFEMLHDALLSAYSAHKDPVKRLEAMIRTYLDFGLQNPEYYEIMFSRNTPKYADYAATAMEPVAFVEKQTALKSADITLRALTDFFGKTKAGRSEDIRLAMLQVWCTLNGMVNLFNSRVLQEVEEHTDEAMERMVAGLMKTIRERAS